MKRMLGADVPDSVTFPFFREHEDSRTARMERMVSAGTGSCSLIFMKYFRIVLSGGC
jgi:hypothetical protein